MRITKEILEDFEAENTVYLELRTTPKRTPHMTKTENLNAITEALRAYTGKMITKLIISVNRAQSIADARENIDLAKTIEECVGIEFSGNPGVNKFEDFKEIFQYARDQGFKISIHTAEEPDHEDTMAILRFAPERLGHCNYLEPEAEDLILSSRIPIEICASSNMLTMNMDNLLNHHFGRFHASGHPLSICTDDTLLVNSTITKEYFMLAQTFNLTIQDMQKIIRDSAEMAFTPGVLEKVGFFLTTQN